MANEVSVQLWNVAGDTFLYDLDNAFNIQWQEVLNEPGIGKFSIAISDVAATSIQVGCMVRCAYRTVTEAFVWRIEEIVWNRTTADEEFGQVIDVTGRGKGVRFGYSRVYPPKGVAEQKEIENRSISFASPEFNDSGWGFAVHLAAQGDMNAPWVGVLQNVTVAAPFAWPRNLPYNTYWIWPSTSTAVGSSYFRQTFALATAEQVTIIASGDNFWTLYLDGKALMGDSSLPTCWQEHRHWQGRLEPGTHLLAAVVDNISDSPAAFLCAVYIENPPICDEEDPPNCVDQPPTVLVVSDYYWRCLGYPAVEPGFTPGYFMLQLMLEAQSRGQLTDVFASFSAQKDSNGAAWEVMPEIGANIGDSMLDVLDNLVAGKWVEWSLSPVEGYPPSGFTATYVAPNVVLNWVTNPITGEPTTYEIYRAGWVEGGQATHYWRSLPGSAQTVTDTLPMPGITVTYILYPVFGTVKYGGIVTTIAVPPLPPVISSMVRDTTNNLYAKMTWLAKSVDTGYDVEWMAPPGVPAFVRIASNMVPGTVSNSPGIPWGPIPVGSGGCWSGASASAITMRVRGVAATGSSAWVSTSTATMFSPPVFVWNGLYYEGGLPTTWGCMCWDCPVIVAGFDFEWWAGGISGNYVRIASSMTPGTIVNNPGGLPWPGPAIPPQGGGGWAGGVPASSVMMRVRSVGLQGQLSEWIWTEGGGVRA